jgi:aspartyl-tRNA(Asn)/glutamyl-tRNA(Gln) amidotransferase subunit A
MTSRAHPFSPWPSVAEIAAAVRSGRTTAAEQAEEAIRRIEIGNPLLNAIILFDPRDIRRRAAEVDRRVKTDEELPLAGVPVTIKDNIWVQGLRITQGSRLFADFIAPASAIAVERIERAGAVISGISNTSEFACKGQTTNPLHGATRNPVDLSRTPGGSSGGPVAAVAGGLVPLAIGTDGGGSGRRPPAHTGLVGFKPSFGAVPNGPGFEEPVTGVSCTCPITRTVAEARLVFEALVGLDPRDPHSVATPAPDASGRAPRVAFTPKWGFDVPVDPDVAANMRAVAAALREAGLDIVVSDPLWPAGMAENALAPLQHAGLAAIHGAAWKADPSQIDPDLGAQIAAGFAYTGVDTARAWLASERVAAAAAAYFADNAIDFAIGPTTPCCAWPIELLGPPTIDGRSVGARGHAVFTPFFNHAKQPAISIPSGIDRDGLPIGLQITAPRGRDWGVLALAERIEAILSARGLRA